jgi:hypothetical protein
MAYGPINQARPGTRPSTGRCGTPARVIWQWLSAGGCRRKAISYSEFAFSGCWCRVDQHAVLGQCRLALRSCCNAYIAACATPSASLLQTAVTALISCALSSDKSRAHTCVIVPHAIRMTVTCTCVRVYLTSWPGKRQPYGAGIMAPDW